jgi:hypothetical protein
MRTLLVGALSATLTSCSCLISPQSSLDGCTSRSCSQRTSTRAPIELTPTPFMPSPATTKVRGPAAANTGKPSSAQSRPLNRGEETTHSPTTAGTESPVSAQPARTSDPVLEKARATIAAKMDDPASAEFGDMKRASRKNTLGKSDDTSSVPVKGKKASGEDTGEMPFLYLVKEDEAYVVDGNAESAAAIAYRNICADPNARGKDSRQKQDRK